MGISFFRLSELIGIIGAWGPESKPLYALPFLKMIMNLYDSVLSEQRLEVGGEAIVSVKISVSIGSKQLHFF